MSAEHPPREHFYLDEEELFARLKVLKKLVAEQELENKPCNLLAAQLNELAVLTRRLQDYVRRLDICVHKAGHRAS